MKGLNVAPGVVLPVDYVTQTAAIMAQRRKGKTYLAAVLAEELSAARMPWVALDPTGAWWGLRSSADGERAGLPVVVIGGQHGDLPLDVGAGAAVADLVLDHPGWYVVDLSLLEGRPDERQFATAFGQRLHRRKMQAGMDFPLHLFLDEADLFVPQEKETRGDVALLAAYQGIVRRGGLHGLGVTLISQRPALVNKNALTQLDLLVLLRIVAGNDQDAVQKNYVSRFMAKAEAGELMASLATLPVGEAWFLEPGADPPRVTRTKARQRRTFNSSATPKPGEKRVEPKVLAKVDLDALRDRMAESVARAEADDPVKLRARVRELEAKLRAPSAQGPVEVMVEVPVETLVEVPVFTDAERELLERAAKAVDGVGEQLANVRDVIAGLTPRVERREQPKPTSSPKPQPPPRRPDPPPTYAPPPETNGSVQLKAGARRIVEALAAHHPMRMTRAQVAMHAKLRRTGGTFGSYWSAVKTAGLIEEGADGRTGLTEAGLQYAGGARTPRSPEELLEMWRDRLKAGARAMLDVLVELDGDPIEREQLAARVGLEARGGTFGSYLSTLNTAGLAEVDGRQVRAADALFLSRSAA